MNEIIKKAEKISKAAQKKIKTKKISNDKKERAKYTKSIRDSANLYVDDAEEKILEEAANGYTEAEIYSMEPDFHGRCLSEDIDVCTLITEKLKKKGFKVERYYPEYSKHGAFYSYGGVKVIWD